MRSFPADRYPMFELSVSWRIGQAAQLGRMMYCALRRSRDLHRLPITDPSEG
jgi:hypothetical protein